MLSSGFSSSCQLCDRGLWVPWGNDRAICNLHLQYPGRGLDKVTFLFFLNMKTIES